jgi:hypothetical protein
MLNRPRLLKGALLTIGEGSDASLIAFQYNPEKLTRNLSPQYTAGEQNNKAERLRFQGAPSETIDVDVIVDAIDQLANPRDTSTGGIHPQLAALELLGAPTVEDIRNSAAKNTIEILPWLVPTTVFVYGVNRIVPVRVESVKVTEELHDPDLNPIRANVSLSMRVVTCSTTLPKTKAYEAWMTYQQHKERLARPALQSATAARGNPRAAASDYLKNSR